MVEIGPGDVADFGDCFGGVPDPRGSAWAFAPVGCGRKEGSIGFDHEAIERHECRGGAHIGGIGIGDDAGEGDHGAEIEALAGIVDGSGEAVEDHPIRRQVACAEDGNKVVKGFAAMQDDGFRDARGVQLRDVVELFGQHKPLKGGGWAVVVVVEAEFTPRHAFGMAGEFSKSRPGVGAMVGIKRVYPRGSPNAVESSGEIDGGLCIVERRRDGDAAGDSGHGGFVEQVGKQLAEFGEGEMAMGVDHANRI